MGGGRGAPAQAPRGARLDRLRPARRRHRPRRRGLVVGIVPESRNVAHRLIEEFMLAANEAVAKKLLFAKQPAIYRVHDRPDPDRLVDLREVLESFGYELKGDLEELAPTAFQKLLDGDRGQARGAAAPRPAAARAAQGRLQRGVPRPLRAGRAVLLPLHLAHPPLSGPRSSTGSSRGCSRRARPFAAKDFEAVNERFARDRDGLLGARAPRRAGRARESALEEDRLHEGQGRARVRRLRDRRGILRRLRDAQGLLRRGAGADVGARQRLLRLRGEAAPAARPRAPARPIDSAIRCASSSSRSTRSGGGSTSGSPRRRARPVRGRPPPRPAVTYGRRPRRRKP